MPAGIGDAATVGIDVRGRVDAAGTEEPHDAHNRESDWDAATGDIDEHGIGRDTEGVELVEDLVAVIDRGDRAVHVADQNGLEHDAVSSQLHGKVSGIAP
ncbi:MAG: hypothetical protein HOV94_14300 [Saccharothrix sp.]|nr:hypothetical protein [Saccharothrix sp.]